jgi:chromosome segregation ATPase
VKVSADLFGKRFLEVTKGKAGPPTVNETTNKTIVGILNFQHLDQRQKALLEQKKTMPEILQQLKAEAAADEEEFYRKYTDGVYCWINPDEAPALNERLERLADQVEAALPNILDLTNRIVAVLDEGINAASNASAVLTAAQPILDNIEQITDQIRDPDGSLGDWLIPPDIRQQLTNTLDSANLTMRSANTTLTNADAQITTLALELERTLENLSSITSNLNAQVAANSNLVKEISDAIVHADEFVQGIKRHWLLRSAFKSRDTNQPPRSSSSDSPLRAGKPIW